MSTAELPLWPAQARLKRLPAPQARGVLQLAHLSGGVPDPPKKKLLNYSPEEWEYFVFEWASVMDTEYVEVLQLGGANDGGIDVAAFRTVAAFEGSWDCFQCKHYNRVLYPGDAWPEIFKILRGVAAGDHTAPNRYYFVAPRGCGNTLNKWLHSPGNLKDEFLKELTKGKAEFLSDVGADVVAEVASLAMTVDFSLFTSMSLTRILEIHKRSPAHAVRFGGPLPERPEVPLPPEEIGEQETRYLQHLLDVYEEKFSLPAGSLDEALKHGLAGSHLRRQRISFYSAEALRVFARDNVPEGTFEALQEEVFDSVEETYSRE
nr:ABC-three component system protein [Candidatus Protofrankia californiensis]